MSYRLLEKMVNEDWVGNFFHFSVKQGIIHETRKYYSEYIFLKYRAKVNNVPGCRSN